MDGSKNTFIAGSEMVGQALWGMLLYVEVPGPPAKTGPVQIWTAQWAVVRVESAVSVLGGIDAIIRQHRRLRWHCAISNHVRKILLQLVRSTEPSFGVFLAEYVCT